MNYPQVGTAFRLWAKENKEFATWAGDVGSAVAEHAMQTTAACAEPARAGGDAYRTGKGREGGHTLDCYLQYVMTHEPPPQCINSTVPPEGI